MVKSFTIAIFCIFSSFYTVQLKAAEPYPTWPLWGMTAGVLGISTAAMEGIAAWKSEQAYQKFNASNSFTDSIEREDWALESAEFAGTASAILALTSTVLSSIAIINPNLSPSMLTKESGTLLGDLSALIQNLFYASWTTGWVSLMITCMKIKKPNLETYMALGLSSTSIIPMILSWLAAATAITRRRSVIEPTDNNLPYEIVSGSTAPPSSPQVSYELSD
jgi:hypothetical protein